MYFPSHFCPHANNFRPSNEHFSVLPKRTKKNQNIHHFRNVRRCDKPSARDIEKIYDVLILASATKTNPFKWREKECLAIIKNEKQITFAFALEHCEYLKVWMINWRNGRRNAVHRMDGERICDWLVSKTSMAFALPSQKSFSFHQRSEYVMYAYKTKLMDLYWLYGAPRTSGDRVGPHQPKANFIYIIYMRHKSFYIHQPMLILSAWAPVSSASQSAKWPRSSNVFCFSLNHF